MEEDSLSQDEVKTIEPVVVDVKALEPVRCPCGWARRAFAGVADSPASVHRVEIEVDARAHYHRDHTEFYYILECDAEAAVELDGQRSTSGAEQRDHDPAWGAAPRDRANDYPEHGGPAVRPSRRVV